MIIIGLKLMSAKNIPPTLNKIDKTAFKAGAFPSPFKNKTKTRKGSCQAINKKHVTVVIVEVCVASSYIHLVTVVTSPYQSVAQYRQFHNICSPVANSIQISLSADGSAISFVVTKVPESCY